MRHRGADTVPILRLVCFPALIGMTVAHNAELLIAVGKVGIATSRITIMQIIRIGALIIAATYSVNIVAAALISMSLLGFFYTMYTLVKHASLEWGRLFPTLRPSFVASATTMIIPFWVYYTDISLTQRSLINCQDSCDLKRSSYARC